MLKQMKSKQWMVFVLMALVAVVPACTTPAAQAGPAGASGGTQAGLAWQGPLDVEGTNLCARLELRADDQVQLGPCGEAGAAKTLTAHQAQEWAEIRARFASFKYIEGNEQLDFQGTGSIASPAWQRALVAWSRFTAMELRSGRVSGSARTVMHWSLGDASGQPGMCRALTVLVHGYAYAEVAPCEGGAQQSVKSGWLETAELESFDAWLYGRGFAEQDGGYFAGLGRAPMSAEDLKALDEWALAVYERLQ